MKGLKRKEYPNPKDFHPTEAEEQEILRINAETNLAHGWKQKGDKYVRA